MVYSPDCFYDSKWAYLCSHDLSRQLGEGGPGDDAHEKSLTAKQEAMGGNSVKREVFDRLSGIVDTEDARFQKLKTDNFKYWEQSVASLCQSINKGVDLFYQGNLKVLKYILESGIDQRDDYIPQACEQDFSPAHTRDASAPYIFQSLPLTAGGVGANFTDDFKLKSLQEKLSESAALALWHEPIDITNNGPEFLDGLRDLILETARTFKEKGQTYSAEERENLQNLHSYAIQSLYGIAILSGNHDTVVSALLTISDYDKLIKHDEKFASEVFGKCSETLGKFLGQIKAVKDQQQPLYHCMQGANMSGVFGLATQFIQNGMTDRNTSITTDDTYLYLYVSIQSRSFMMKIGTGENGSVAGRVIQVETNDTSEVTWVHCKGKLYSKKVSDPFGLLTVHDPETMQTEGQVKLCINDCFANPKLMEGINRNFPLLSDGESLFIVTVQVVQKNKQVREELKPEFELLKTKIKTDAQKAAEKTKDAKDAKAGQKDAKQEKLDKEEAVKRTFEEKAQILEKSKDKQKQRVENRKKRGEKNKEPEKKEEAPKAQEKAELKAYKDIDIYRVCEFSVHEFDLQASMHEETIHEVGQDLPDHELLKEPLCFEMYQAFSGLFEVKDCHKALKFNNDDIETAVQWLIEEKNRPKNESHLQVKKSQVIYESLISTYNQISNTNLDVQVVNSSLLHPNHVTTGKWTLANGQITFHNTGQDNEVISVFSLDGSTTKQVHADKMLQTFQIQQNLFEKNDFTQHYYNGKEWKCHTMQEICENIAKIKSLQSATVETEAKSEGSEKTNFYSPEGFLSELQLYEPIKLHGTLLTHMNNPQRNSSLHTYQNSYITYSPGNKKFYVMVFNGKDKNVAVVEDLANMLPHTEPEPSQDFSSLKSFVDLTLKWLTFASESRYQMPWRWRQWSQLYTNAIEQVENQRQDPPQANKMNINPLSGLPDSTPEQVNDNSQTDAQEAKKLALRKLRKRQTKLTQRELQLELRKLGLSTLSEKEAKEYQAKAEKQKVERLAWNEKQAKQKLKAPQTIPVNIPPPQLKKSNAQAELDMRQKGYGLGLFGGDKKLEAPKPYAGFCDFCDLEQPNTGVCRTCGRILDIDRAFKPPDFHKQMPGNPSQPRAQTQNFFQPTGQYALPNEQICVARENKKIYAFCATGSVESLETVFSMLKQDGDNCTLLRAILEQVTFADNLSAYHNSALLDRISDYILSSLPTASPTTAQYLWRIMIVGWHLFARTQHQQLKTMTLMVTQSRLANAQKPPNSLLECLTRVTTEVAPICLFAARFLSLHSLYPLEFIGMSKVIAQIVACVSEQVFLPKTVAIQNNAVNGDKNELSDKKYLKIKQAYARTYNSEKNIKQFSKVDQSISQMPLEILTFRHAKSGSGLFGGGNTDQYTFRSQSYFSMPIHSILASEPCGVWTYKENSPDLDQLLGYYTSEPMADSEADHSAKYNYFVAQREKSAVLQEDLFKAFTTAILQSISEPEEERADEFCWDENVSVALFRSFSHLIVQAMVANSWSMPFNNELMIQSVKFIEDAILVLAKKTINFSKKFNSHHSRWLKELHRFAQNLVNMLHLSLGSQSQAYLSVKILPSLMNILDQFRRIFNFADSKTKSEQVDSKNKGDSPERNLLDVYVSTNTEGVDATYEHIWETSHPYPKQEIRQTELFRVPKAIGYFVEFDPRCCTNQGQNDYVQLKSQEMELRMGEQVGTKFRSTGKHQPGQNVFILIGKQLEIEFRVTQQRQDRGRRPGDNNQQGRPEDRWGFRLTILPIFTTPSFSPDKVFKKKSYENIYTRLDHEGHLRQQTLYDWFIFFIMTVYLASAFTQDLTDKNQFTQISGTKSIDLGDQLSMFEDQKKEPKDSKRTKEANAVKNIMSSDVLNWHLLKGGLNLQFTKQGPNSVTDMDGYLHECLNQMNSQNFFSLQLKQQLKDLADPEFGKKTAEPLPVERQATLKKQATIKGEKLEEFKPNKDSWATEIKELVETYDVEDKTLDLVLKKIREPAFKAYDFGYRPYLQNIQSFKPFVPLWKSVERLLIAAMLYHSDSISDIKKFLDFDHKSSQEPSKEQLFLKEQFTTIGRQLNVVIQWMLGRLQGAKQLQEIVQWIFNRSQEIIDAALKEKDRMAREIQLMADEDAAAASIRAKEQAEQARKTQEEKKKEELKAQEKSDSKQKKPVVSISKNKAPANKGKKANRPKQARVLPKPQEKSKKPAIEIVKEVEKPKEEEKNHPEEVEKQEPIEPEFLDVDSKLLSDIKEKIEKETLDYLKNELAPAPDTMNNTKLSKLSMFFDMELDMSDFHSMVAKIFKKLKQQIEKILDLDDPTVPILRNLDINKLKQGTPEEQVAREIINRTMLLFELNNSVNFLSEVTKIDNVQRINTFWRGKRMATILEELEEDQTSQQQIFTEVSEGIEQDIENFDSGSEADLVPITVSRSYSVPTTTSTKALNKTPFSNLGAPGAQKEKVLEQRKQSMDYSDFVETYRKWRLWNKKGEDEPELLSPFGSPLLSVVQFVKCAKIQDPSLLRNIMTDQQQLALFRLYGLQMQEKLFILFGHSPFGRYVWGNHSTTLQESTLHSVETCGERLTKQLNVLSRNLVQLLMDRFTFTVKSCLQKDMERTAFLKEYKKIKSDDKDGLKQMNNKAKEEAYESIIVEDLKKVLLLLNDIRVLMNNIYTREHVLESLRQDNQLSTKDSLGIDKIQAFLKSVVQFLMIANASINGSRSGNGKSLWSINKLKVNITHVTRLVLNLFISQDKIMIRQTETQRILQEMLLDITVDQLESKCYKTVNGAVESKLSGGHNQSQQIQLLKLLCEVIRISNDTNSAYQADQKETTEVDTTETPHQAADSKGYFLSAGSQKVIRCATLLAYMLHNVEVPAVMRLTIKCATLLFKLLDLKKLKLPTISSSFESFSKGSVKNEFLLETLKTIGQKIGNVQSIKEQTPVKLSEETMQPEKEEEDIKESKEKALAVESKEEIVETNAEDKNSKQEQYYVICNLNTPEQEDFIFIFTALVHWYLRYPNKSLKLVNDPSEIAQVPKPQTEKEKGDKKAAEKPKEGEKPKEDAKPDEPKKEDGKEPEAVKVEKIEKIEKLEKLPEIVQPKPGEVAKSLEMMFNEKQISELNAAQMNIDEDAQLAELQAMQDDNQAVIDNEEKKMMELAQKFSLEKQEISEMDKQELLSLELAQQLELEEEKILEDAIAKEVKNEPPKNEEKKESPKSQGKKDEPAPELKLEEEKKHSEEVEKVEPEEDKPLSDKVVKVAKKIDLRPIDEYKDLLPEIYIIQACIRKWLAARKKPVEPKLTPEQTNELRVVRIIKMLESIKEIKNSIALQRALEVQKQELKKLQALREAQLLAKSVPDKLNDKNPAKPVIPRPSTAAANKDSLKSRFESVGAGLQENHNIKFGNLIQAVDAIIKETYKDPLTTDTDEEKKRCVEEKNYYTRLQAILRETVQLAEQLYARNTAILEGPYTLEKASELADLLSQAYRGQLLQVSCNPHMKEEMAIKPIQMVASSDAKKSAKDLFPVTAAKLDEISKPKTKVDTAVPEIIKVAQKNVVVTVINKVQAHEFVREVQMRIAETRTQNRQSRPGLPSQGNISLVSQHGLNQGASQSLIIQELVQLIRSMLQGAEASESQNEIQSEFVQLFNFTTKELATRSWNYEYSEEEQFIVMGMFYILSGWQPQIKTGQLIQVNQNNTWINATVVDEGSGKDKISVILDEDDSMQITKFNKEKARPINRFELELDGDLGSKIDQNALIESVIHLDQQIRNTEDIIAERQIEYASNQPTSFAKSILSTQNLLLQMLRTCSQLKWNSSQKENSKFSDFIQIMINISAGKDRSSPGDLELMEFEEDKLMAHWERQLIQSWQRLVEKSEKRNLRMFVPREFVQPENQLKRQSTSVLQSQGIIKQGEGNDNSKQMIDEAAFSPQHFTQTPNTFLSGLPQITQKKNSELLNLKRLQYWERNIVPQLIKFCTGYYKGWEWNMYFGQLRMHLSSGQIEAAHEDTFQMFGKQPPPGGCPPIPDVDFDWSPKIIDECICDEWAIAKIAPSGAKSKQAKNQSNQTASKTNIPFIDNLLHLEIDEILVQIKAVDGRSNSVFAQYFDSDSMTTSYLWLPINSLSELAKPLPQRPIGFSNRKLAEDYENSISKISQIYSRQTLIKLFMDFQQTQQQSQQIVSLPTQNLRLQELISWSVWETFCNQPVDGWLKQVSPVIMLDEKPVNQDNQSHTFQTLVEETLDKIAKEELMKNVPSKGAHKEKLHKKNDIQRPTEVTLSIVRDIFSEISAKHTDNSKPDPLFSELVDWCVTNWYAISGSIGKSRACIEISEECRKYKTTQPKESQGFSNSLPLHNLVPGKGANAIATLILFKKNKVKLTPGSKLMLFSDAEKTDLLQEISAATLQQQSLDPMVIAKGKVWVEFEEGSNCLVPIDMRNDERSSIECAVFHIPKEWPVVCWLTGVIASTLVKTARTKSPQFAIDVFSKLIGAIQVFYDESRAPFFLKTIILKLISRLIVKLRIVYIEIEQHNKKTSTGFKLEDHFKRLFVTPEFIQTLLSELLVQMDTKACNAINNGNEELPVPDDLGPVLEFQNKEKIFHPHFAQEAIEFLMQFFIPTSRKIQLESYKDLLPQKQDSQDKVFSLPLWIEPLIKLSQFLHYLRSQATLPNELQKKIFAQTKLGPSNLDNVILLRGLPSQNPVYTKSWITNRIFELLKKHKARVLEPAYDVTFIKAADEDLFDCVVVIDGFSHMRLLDDGENEDNEEMQRKHKIELLVADSEEEDTSKNEEEAKREAEKAKRAEEEKPKEWDCPVCTVLNPIRLKSCDCCGSEAPPMDQIVAAHMVKINEERKQKGETVAEVKEESESLHIRRLKMLKNDLRHMISDEQRTKMLADIEEKKKRDKEEAEKAAIAKAEEEAKNAKEQDKKDDVPKADVKPVADSKEVVDPKVVVSPLQDDKVVPVKEIIKEESKNSGPPQRRNSFASQEDSNWEDQSNNGEPKDEDDIDVDNLPEDRYERFRILGLDTMALDEGDNDFAKMLEDSAIEDLTRRRESKKAEKEAKRIAEEEERKKQEREAAKKALANADNPVSLIKIETLIGQKTVFTHEKACIIAQDVLRARLMDRKSLTEQVDASEVDSKTTGEFKFSAKVIAIIKQIHQNFKKLKSSDLELPEKEPLLADFEITKEFLAEEESFETVLDLFSTLAIADVRLLYKVFESQGYDLHLTQAALPTHNIQALFSAGLCSRATKQFYLQSQIKRLVEQDYCDYGGQVIHMNPSEFRLLHKYEDMQKELEAYTKVISTQVKEDVKAEDAKSEVKQQVTEKSEKKESEEEEIKTDKKEDSVAEVAPVFEKKFQPTGYFNDTQCESIFKDVYNGLTMAEIRYVWATLKTFNEYYVPAVPIINQGQSFIELPQDSVPLNIGLYMKDLRELSLNCVKTNLRFLILDQTSVDVEIESRPILYFDRLKMAEKANAANTEAANQVQKQATEVVEEKPENQHDNTNRDFMFVKAYEQCRDIGLAMLRPKRPKGSDAHIAFEINFQEEDVVGWSGPYKQFFQSISEEVQPNKLESLNMNQLSLMCPSANQRDKEQFGAEKFVLTSSELNPRKLQYFEFLGILMGVGIRTGVNMVFDLPQITWKQLIGSTPSTEDIFQIEYRFFKKMTNLLIQSEEEFEYQGYEWTVTLADGKELDLTYDGTGKEKVVKYTDRLEYVKRCIYAKLTESSLQCAAIRRGLVKIIPESLLNQISYEEMESWVCGDKYIDVDLIRRNTKYVGYTPNDQTILNFWEFFEELVQNDRRRFIKFIYAIERLPPTDDDWKRTNTQITIQTLTKPNRSADELLPEVSTCFFQLKLPKYSTKERMRKQIVCAFTNDNESMNAEHDAHSRELRRDHGGDDRRNSYDDQSGNEEE